MLVTWQYEPLNTVFIRVFTVIILEVCRYINFSKIRFLVLNFYKLLSIIRVSNKNGRVPFFATPRTLG